MTGRNGDGPRPQMERGWRLWRLAALRSAGLPFDLLATLATESEDDAAASTSAGISHVLRDETFRAALTWQNPELVRNWFADWHHASAPRHDRVRREAVLARYAQRYCAKNDTIGFFGPVAWAELGAAATGYTGGGEVRHRRVSYESWAIQAVAEAWNDDPELWPHLPVRLAPACTVDGAEVIRPLREPLTVADSARRVLEVLPSARCVTAIRELSGLGAAADATLLALRAQHVLQVGFLVPLDIAPERHLTRQITAIDDPAVRQRLSGVLADLVDAATAARDAREPKALLAALTDVDRRLEKATGEQVGHRPGLAGGGRTPLYLDCRRDLDATIGPESLDPLRLPLSILLDSSRWLAGQVGEVVDEALRQRYLMLRTRRRNVTLADLQLAAADVLSGADGSVVDVVSDFQLRWAEILPAGEQDAVVDQRQARQLADVLFPAAGRWWAAARTHSPDLMVRRRPDGKLGWVLGELHVALNTMENRFFSAHADDRSALVDAVAADAAPGRVVPVYPNTSAEVSPRTYPPPSLDPPGRYRYWSFGQDVGHASGAQSTPATALTVHERDDRLYATGDGWTAPVLECFGEFVTALVVNLFQLRPSSRYAPRVDIGWLTVCRRTWHLPVAEAGAVAVRSTDPSHRRLRDWAESNGVTRHAFARTPQHPKPFYVDFTAPVLVDNLARAMRRAGPGETVRLVEMLPTPDELWLRLAGNQRYTSELRLVAVDPMRPDPASWPDAGAARAEQKPVSGKGRA